VEPTEEHSNELIADHIMVVATVLPQRFDK
jgi:hypothetical protein